MADPDRSGHSERGGATLPALFYGASAKAALRQHNAAKANKAANKAASRAMQQAPAGTSRGGSRDRPPGQVRCKSGGFAPFDLDLYAVAYDPMFARKQASLDPYLLYLINGQVCQAYDTAVHFFNRGCRAFHTFSRMRCCASSVGWSWSC